MNYVITDFSFILRAVSPLKSTITVLSTFKVVALIDVSIRLGLYAMAMLHVIFPLSTILRSMGISVLTVAFRLIIDPLALINVTVYTNIATAPV